LVGISHDSYSQKFLGTPYNISAYALLIHLVAHVTDLEDTSKSLFVEIIPSIFTPPLASIPKVLCSESRVEALG
jgi:hypothetical protein